jgi:hypothetical protein
MIKIAIILAVVTVSTAVKIQAQTGHARALPHVLVYKTKANYRNQVPVLLSDDKSKIVSYPGPGDLKTGGALALPVLLHKGYLLDKRGIGPNSAFTKYTYEEYSHLTNFPSIPELYNTIADKNPLAELYDCGVRNNDKNSVDQLNKIIDAKQLKKKCIKMK